MEDVHRDDRRDLDKLGVQGFQADRRSRKGPSQTRTGPTHGDNELPVYRQHRDEVGQIVGVGASRRRAQRAV